MSTTAEVLSAIYAETGGTDPFGGTLQEAIDITWANIQAFFEDLAPSAVSTMQVVYGDFPVTTESYPFTLFDDDGNFVYTTTGPPDYTPNGPTGSDTGIRSSDNSTASMSVGAVSSPDGSVIEHPTLPGVPLLRLPGTWEIGWTMTPSGAGAASRPLSGPPPYEDGPWWGAGFAIVTEAGSVGQYANVEPRHHKELNTPGDPTGGAYTVENWVSDGDPSGTMTTFVSPYASAEFYYGARVAGFQAGNSLLVSDGFYLPSYGHQATLDLTFQLIEAAPITATSDASRVEQVIADMWAAFASYRQWWS